MSEDRSRAATRVLRVFFDWGHVWPLWESGEKYTMEPTDYGYSAGLTETLRRWQRAWAPIADFEMGETERQPTVDEYDRYEQLARTALAGILAETPADVAISVEMADVQHLVP